MCGNEHKKFAFASLLLHYPMYLLKIVYSSANVLIDALRRARIDFCVGQLTKPLTLPLL